MIPAFTSSATASVSAIADAVLSTDGKSVNYAIDYNTSFEYELTYMGFKENIVVNEYTGQTEYSFIDQGHLRGSYDDCYGTSTVYADTAGNYFASATEITIPREYHSRKIDYRGDIDYYTFTNDTAGDYLFEFTANQGVPLTVVLYNERQEVLQTYYSAVGDIEFEYTLNENSIYVISVSSSGQTEHEFVRSYNISITESS